MNVRLGAVLFILVLVGGCKSTEPASSASSGSSGDAGMHYSGFLGDYSQLKPVPDREGVMAYLDKNVDLRPYNKVTFDPVEVVMTPNPEYKGVPKEALARMSENFLASFRRALSPAYEVVSQPGPGVLRIRTAITGVQPAKPQKGAIDFLPIKAVINVGREAAGAGPRVAEMTAEMEVLDPTGKRVMAATANRKGDKKLPQGEQVTWNELQEISDYWAQNFRRRLDELRGVSSAKP